MPSPDSNFESPQDAELRAVPVPEGFLQRLRRTSLANDDGLDAALRQVPLPCGLLARLRQMALADDEGLGAAIRDVPLPSGLSERLRRSVLAEEEGLDASAGDVPFPVDLLGRLRRAPRGRLRRLVRWAAAASLLIAAGLSYVGAMVAFLVAAYPANENPPPELASRLTPSSSSRPDGLELEFSVAIASDGGEPDHGMFTRSMPPGPEIKLVRYPGPKPTPLAAVRDLFDPSGADALLEVGYFGWGRELLLSHSIFDDLPELEKVPDPIPRGIDPPVIRAFNWPFYLWHGVFPPVFPAAHPTLHGGLVPLGVDSSSYELTRRYLKDGELPATKDVRTEEFLAAVDYGFPPPKREALGLCTAGGPSPFGTPFGSEPVLLLQIGVQGRDERNLPHRPIHLVVTVDVSASMRWGGRLEMIRRAVGDLAGQIGPDDRISLVAFSEDAEVVVEGVCLDEADQLRAAVESLCLQGSTNLGAGMRQAFAVAQRAAVLQKTAVRVVLLTDGLTELGRGTAVLIEQRLAEAAGRGILLEVVDLQQKNEPDRQLASFAQSGGGKVYRATNADQVRWALLEIVTEKSQLIAEEARLKVIFNPKTVLAYRLLGHEATSMVGLMPAHPEADFHAGRSATVLYEVHLRPKGGKDVATVELSWRKPGGSSTNRRTLTHTVHRGDFASSFVGADPSLQEAALVAETAEVLRNSPFVQPPRGRVRALARVLELSAHVDPRLSQRPTFVEFMSLVKQAVKAKAYRSGAGR